MNGKFVGTRVKIVQHSIGTVIGVVKAIENDHLVLNNVLVNQSSQKQHSVKNEDIRDIEIMSMDDAENTPVHTPVKVETKTTPRHNRREWLRNIPNSLNAYVCPDSPPLICKSNVVIKPTVKNIQITKQDGQKAAKKSSKGRTRCRSESEKLSKAYCADVESDSACYRQRPSKSRQNARRNDVVWDKINVEDFVDQDFDFEQSNATFDKQAVYSMIDAELDTREGPQVRKSNPVVAKKSDKSIPARPIGNSVAQTECQQPLALQVEIDLKQRNRLIHYLATGVDPAKELSPASVAGLDWRPLLENVAGAVCQALKRSFHSQSKSVSPNVAIVPSGANFGGALSLCLARQLATLGAACVVLVSPDCCRAPLDEDAPCSATEKQTSRLAAVYRQEYELCRFLFASSRPSAPKKTNIWESGTPGIDFIAHNQGLGRQFPLDAVVYGHGLSTESESLELLSVCSNWLGIHAKSIGLSCNLVNPTPLRVNTGCVTPKERWLIEIGLPVRRPRREEPCRQRTFVARVPAGEVLASRLLKQQIDRPAGLLDSFYEVITD